MTPYFTVVVPAYGCAKYLEKLFDSLDAQTFRDFEVVLAVENSMDDSLARCRAWAAERPDVTVLDLPCTGAGGASRNRAYEIAKGRYLVPLDGDDWLDVEALEALAERLRQADEPEVANVTARIVLEKDDGELSLGGTIANLTEADDGLVVSGVEFLRKIGRRGQHCKNHGALVVVRTDFLREHGLLQLEGVPSEDSEWTPRVLLSASRVLFLAEPRYNYRRHDGSVSSLGTNRILFATARIALELARLFNSRELPSEVRRYLENDALSIFNWYLFHKAYAKRFSRADRLKALDMVFADETKAACYRSLWESASVWKRLAWPLVVLARRTRFLLPATAYFRYVYYPLTGAVKG